MLVTSGIEVARRQGAADPSTAGAEALRQMREMQLLPGAVLSVDATDHVEAVVSRVRKLLTTNILRVKAVSVEQSAEEQIAAANIEGM